MDNRETKKIIGKVQSLLNLQIAIDIVADGLILGGGGMIITSLFFVLNGYRVQLLWLVIPTVLALLFMIIRFIMSRYDKDAAAVYADSHFSLNNALVSMLDFERRSTLNGFHRQHFSKTESACAAVDLSSLRLYWPWRRLTAAGLTGAVVLIMVTLDNSPTVKAARAQRAETIAMTEELNHDLRNEIKTLEKKLSPAEKKLFENAELDKLVNQLKIQEEFKAAMRQYAKLEKTLNKLSANKQLQNNRRLLREIARQLMKVEAGKKLGQHFNRGEYRQAAEELEKLKRAGEQEKSMTKLKKVLKKMKKASEQQSGNQSHFKDKLAELNEAVDKYDNAMEKKSEKENINTKESLSQAKHNAETQLNEFNEALAKQQVAEEFINKLSRIRSAMQQAQQKMRELANGLGRPANSGMPVSGNDPQNKMGQEIGSATAHNRRKAEVSTEKDGKLSKITGKKGSGSSFRKVESATSGRAVSRRMNKAANEKFIYKMEEFVRRNDVPDDMKDGVKRYFSDLHDAGK